MLRNAFSALLLAPLFLTGCEMIAPPENQDQSAEVEDFTPITQAVTSANNLVVASQVAMTSDTNADGLANGFVKVAGTGNSATYSVANPAGQKIKITASTSTADAAANYNTFMNLIPESDVDAAVDVQLVAAGKVGARLDVLYYKGSTFLSRKSSPLYKLTTTPNTPVYKRIYVTKHRMPTTATRMKLAVVLVHLASGTTGEATFRNIGVAAASLCAPATGQACQCGGVFQCNGMCSALAPATLGQPCGGCGGTVQCDATCSVPAPANLGLPCGQCGGVTLCDATCSVLEPAYIGQPCGGCGGVFNCSGMCSIPTPVDPNVPCPR